MYTSQSPHTYISLLLQKLAVVVVLLLFYTHTHTPNNKTIPFDFRFALAALLVLIETVEEVNSSLHFFIQFPSLDFSSSRRLPYLSLSAVIQDPHTHTHRQTSQKILIIPTGTFSTSQKKTPEVLILI